MTDNLFFVMAAGDKFPTLTIGGLPVCDNGQKSQPDVGIFPLGSSLDDGLDYFQVQGAAARERLAE